MWDVTTTLMSSPLTSTSPSQSQTPKWHHSKKANDHMSQDKISTMTPAQLKAFNEKSKSKQVSIGSSIDLFIVMPDSDRLFKIRAMIESGTSTVGGTAVDLDSEVRYEFSYDHSRRHAMVTKVIEEPAEKKIACKSHTCGRSLLHPDRKRPVAKVTKIADRDKEIESIASSLIKSHDREIERLRAREELVVQSLDRKRSEFETAQRDAQTKLETLRERSMHKKCKLEATLEQVKENHQVESIVEKTIVVHIKIPKRKIKFI